MSRYYNVWAGNLNGTAEDPGHCVVSVTEHSSWPHSGQCGRKRGHGPDGLYCWQHAKMLACGEMLFVPKDREAAKAVRVITHICWGGE